MNDALATTKRTRTLPKGDIVIFRAACNALNTPPRVMSEKLGYTAHASDNWQKDGQVPKVVEVACAALVDARAAELASEELRAQKPQVFVLVVDASQVAVVTSVCEAIGATLTPVVT